jgi:hypothetical protein
LAGYPHAVSGRSCLANASIELSEITMFNESKYVSLIYEQGLDQWTRAWYREASKRNLSARRIIPTPRP